MQGCMHVMRHCTVPQIRCMHCTPDLPPQTPWPPPPLSLNPSAIGPVAVRLQRLTLIRCSVDERSLMELAGMMALRVLEFGGVSHVVTGEGLAALIVLCTCLPSLERVEVSAGSTDAGDGLMWGRELARAHLMKALARCGKGTAAIEMSGW